MEELYEKGAKIIIVISIILLGLIGAYLAFTPQYKSINMSGFELNVPKSNAHVENVTTNYNTYTDTEHNLTIKTWSCQDLSDLNGSVIGSQEMGKHLADNYGNNTTYKNITLFNKSGTYTYYNANITGTNIILITTNNLETMEHIVKNLKQPNITYSQTDINNSNITLNLTNDTVNDTNVTNNTSTSTQSVKKTSSNSNKKSSSSNDGYHYSAQYGEYIKEYTDSNGVQHIQGKSGVHESYNPKTGVLTTKDRKGNVYQDYMG